MSFAADFLACPQCRQGSYCPTHSADVAIVTHFTAGEVADISAFCAEKDIHPDQWIRSLVLDHLPT